MARKDVELVIRAKDEAAKAVNAVTAAINGLTGAQDDLQKSAEKSDTTLSRLGSALSELSKKMAGLSVAGKLAGELDKATAAVARLEAGLRDTAAESDKLNKAAAEAAANSNQLRDAANKAADAVKRQSAAFEKSRTDLVAMNKALRDSVAARQLLENADKRLTATLVKQEARILAAQQRYKGLGEQISKTTEPTKTLQARFEAANVAIEKHVAKLAELKSTQAATRDQIARFALAEGGLAAQIASTNEAFARQETTLDATKKTYAELQASVRSAADQQKRLEDSARGTAEALTREQAALDRAKNDLVQLAAAAGKADVAMAELAAGSTAALKASFDLTRRAMLETRREWVQAELALKKLAAGMTAIGPPTRQQAAAWGLAVTAARAAKAEYRAQQTGLQQLSTILKQTATSVDQLRARQEAFVATQGRVGQSIASIRQQAAGSVAAYQRLAAEAGKAARAQGEFRAGGGGSGPPPVGPVNSLADAYRRLYGETRLAMSFTQRLRGEVLSLVSSFAGIYGIINALRSAVDAFRALEAAGSRLNVVFDSDRTAVAAELDFIRRNADRLGISFGELADEYTKFAVATKGTNLEGQNTRKIFISVAEAGRVNKLSLEQMKGVFTALTQIVSKGKVQMEELRQQLGDRLPGAIQIMADALGVTTEQLFEMTAAGEVSSDALIKFAEELDKRFGSALAAALKTTTTEMGRFQNTLFKTLIAFGQAGFIESFTNLLKSLNETMNSAQFQTFIAGLSKAVAVLVDALGLLVENFDLVVVAMSAFVGIKLTPIIVALASNFGVLAANMGRTAVVARATATAVTSAGTAAAGASRLFQGLSLILRGLFSGGLVGLAITAVATGIGFWATRAGEATEALNVHQRMVDDVKNAYDAAGREVDKWASKIKETTLLQANASLIRVRAAAEAAREAARVATPGLGSRGTTLRGESLEQLTALRNLQNQFIKTGGSVDDYKDKVVALANLAVDESVREFALALLDAADSVRGTEKAVVEAEGIIKVLMRTVDEATKAIFGFGEELGDSGDAAAAGAKKLETYKTAIRDLSELIPALADGLERLDALAKIEAAHTAAIGAAQTIEQAIAASTLRAQAIGALDAKGFEAAESALSGFTDGLKAAEELIRRREGFIPTPKFDVNHQRVGFGSDTVTLADGSVKEVVAGMRVSYIDANRDLARRVALSQSQIGAQIGRDRFAQFNATQQAVLTSVAYNYGNLPENIVKAILAGGTDEQIAQAIKARQFDNEGVNAGRRKEEAFLFTSQAGGPAAVKEAERLAELEGERVEKASEYNLALEQRLAQQAVENANQGQLTKEAFIQKALFEEQQRAKAAGVTLTDEQIAKVKALAAAEFERVDANRQNKTEIQAANEALALASALTTQQATLEREIAAARQSGDQGRVEELGIKLSEVNAQLAEAIAKATAMWQAIGGPGADAALAKLETFKIKSQQTAQSTFLDWSRVAQMFASGLTNAIDKFIGALAEGKDVGEAAKEAFLQFAADFLRQIAQMIIQQAILNALQGFFPGLGGIGVGLGHTGGLVGSKRIGSGNMTRTVHPGIFNNAMRMHGGGVVGLRPGEVPAILKRNEEVLDQNDPRHMFNAAEGGAGAAPGDVKIVNAFDTASFLEEALRSRVGERSLLNFVRANASAFRQAIQG